MREAMSWSLLLFYANLKTFPPSLSIWLHQVLGSLLA